MAGNLPLDSDLEDIPMWPEALARPRVASEAPVIFPSDLDAALPRPIVSSFYALHGGVGRSTALAYTARILASRGYAVLCVDMDLEAPALAALFGKENELRAGRGLVSVLLALDQGTEPDMVKHMLRLSEFDTLYCLPPVSRMQIMRGVCACSIRKPGTAKSAIRCMPCWIDSPASCLSRQIWCC